MTHRAAEVRTTVWALPNKTKSCRVAAGLGLGLELAALLCGHCVYVFGRVR